MIDLMSNGMVWVWAIAAVFTGLELLTPKGRLKRLARVLAGLAICGASLLTLSERTLDFLTGVGTCFKESSVECALLVAGDTMPASLFFVLAVFLTFALIVLLWWKLNSPTETN